MQSSGPSTLLDLAGAGTSVQLNVAAPFIDFTNGAWNVHSGDLLALLDDSFVTGTLANWTLSITGLSNGGYDIYYYAPSHPAVETGRFTINGVNAPNTPGSGGNTFTPGTDWNVVGNVQVSDGTLSAASTVQDFDHYYGLAGLQIVQVPEPSSAFLLAVGCVFVGTRGHSRRNRAPRR